MNEQFQYGGRLHDQGYVQTGCVLSESVFGWVCAHPAFSSLRSDQPARKSPSWTAFHIADFSFLLPRLWCRSHIKSYQGLHRSAAAAARALSEPVFFRFRHWQKQTPTVQDQTQRFAAKWLPCQPDGQQSAQSSSTSCGRHSRTRDRCR